MKARFLTLATLCSMLALVMTWSMNRSAKIDASDVTFPPQHSRLVVQTPQGDREYVLHVPTYCNNSTSSPLVIMLHGFGGTSVNALQESQWSSKADKESFIVAYPEATRPNKNRPPNFRKNPQSWNDGSDRFHASTEKIDDVAFIDAMIEQISQIHAIDANRIFITGFSNGASMTFRLGAELSHPIAAIAPISGTCWIEKPKPLHPISICYITGMADSLNPVNGGYPKLAFGGKEQGRPKPPVRAFIDAWVKSLECSAEPLRDDVSNGIHTQVFGASKQNSEIMFITVEDLGHHWPGGVSQLPSLIVGKPSNKLAATDLIWDFFKSHSASKH